MNVRTSTWSGRVRIQKEDDGLLQPVEGELAKFAHDGLLQMSTYSLPTVRIDIGLRRSQVLVDEDAGVLLGEVIPEVPEHEGQEDVEERLELVRDPLGGRAAWVFGGVDGHVVPGALRG